MSIAVELFKQKSSIEISFESIADKADISRKTLYNYFSSKEQLIVAIVSPIFQDGNQYLDSLAEKKSIKLEDIWNMCLLLWDNYGDTLVLLYHIDFEEYPILLDMHTTYMIKFLRIFERAEDLSKNIKVPCPKIALIVYKCFVPLLSSIDELNNYQEIFHKAMQGLIKGLE